MKVRKILYSLGSITALSATETIAAITTSCNKQTSDSFIINVDKAFDEYYICGKQSSVYKFSALSKSTGTAVKSVTYNPLFLQLAIKSNKISFLFIYCLLFIIKSVKIKKTKYF